jgi:exopolyphosphatase/guanosine-5'-triphosphate,3'-diphosphate pyrophosphatase
LQICADKLKRRNVHLARSVATEACRRAVNGEEFIERVRAETGIALDIISAQEEARLAVLGCHILLEPGRRPGDDLRHRRRLDRTGADRKHRTVPRILDWQSVPWGVVSLTETCGDRRRPTMRSARRALCEMRELVRDSFAVSPADRGRIADQAGRASEPLRLLGTSGTVTTLASLHLELPQYDRRAVDGLIVPADSMREISREPVVLMSISRAPRPALHRARARRSGGGGLRDPGGDSRPVAGRPAWRGRSRHPRGHPAQPDRHGRRG